MSRFQRVEPHAVPGEPVSELSAAGEAVGTEDESTEFESDRSASHNVDPLPPAEFRLFGLGGKKKKPEEAQPHQRPKKPSRHLLQQSRRFRRAAGWLKKK